jgi:hypothetical protein
MSLPVALLQAAEKLAEAVGPSLVEELLSAFAAHPTPKTATEIAAIEARAEAAATSELDAKFGPR